MATAELRDHTLLGQDGKDTNWSAWIGDDCCFHDLRRRLFGPKQASLRKVVGKRGRFDVLICSTHAL